jgi:hypothetical protein
MFIDHPRGIPHKLLMTFAFILALNVSLWLSVKSVRTEWGNVPPVPSKVGALWTALGDEQFAYRLYGLFIQNMGDTGGRVINLNEYNYEELAKWFNLQNELDQRSDFSPFLAGYFFGNVRDPEKLRPLVDYLEKASGNGEGQKWRFLAQAAFLARFKMKDQDRALELAYKLSSFENPKMAPWAKQMPAFILSSEGEKEAAFTLMVSLLETERENLHPNEVNAMLDFICTRTLDKDDARIQKICASHTE